MSWENIKLGEVATVTSSKRIFASQYTESGVPFYRQKEIIDKKNKIEISDPLYISYDTYLQIRNRFGVPKKGDLLITAVGATLGIPFVVDDEIFYFKDGNLIWLKNFSENINSRFVYYWITSDIGQKSMWAKTIGSAQPALTIDIIKQIEVPMPPIEIQNSISNVLCSFDILIENNQRQIKLLEEAAQRLYKEWFVDLRFPGHETTTIIDGIPEGWKKAPLGDLIDYEIGGGWGEELPTEKCDQPAYVIRGTDLYDVTHGNAKSIPYRYHAQNNLNSRKLQDGDIVFEVSGGSKNEGVARTALVTKSLVDFLGEDVICASFCKLIRFKNKSAAKYMYDMFQYLRNSGETVKYDKRSASSIVNYRWKDFLEQQFVFIPSTDVLAQYNALAENMQKIIVNKAQIIEQAKQARDRLLPKLMSGELEV